MPKPSGTCMPAVGLPGRAPARGDSAVGKDAGLMGIDEQAKAQPQSSFECECGHGTGQHLEGGACVCCKCREYRVKEGK